MPRLTGRGATENATSRRFALPEREADGDWLDAQPLVDGAPPKLRTSVTVERPRTIIARNSSPDIPFDRSINPYRGCDRRRHGYPAFFMGKEADGPPTGAPTCIADADPSRLPRNDGEAARLSR